MENTNLQVLYKILAAMPFHTQDGRPLQVCYICRAILMKCYRLRVNCLRSEAWFTQILAKKGSNDVPLHNIHKLKIHHPVLRLRLEPEFMETTQNTPEAEDEPVVKKRKLIYKESAENIIPRNPAKDNMDSYNSEQWENSCKVSFLSWKDKNEDVKQSQDCSSTKLIETNAGNIKLENEQIKQEYTEEDTELDKLYIEQDINDFDEGTMVLGGKVLTKQEGEAMSEVDNLPVKHDQIDVKKEYDEIEYLSVKQKEMVTVHDIELQYLVKQENSNNSNVNQNEVNFEEDLDEPENFGLEIENVTKPEMSLEISTQNGGKTLENTGFISIMENDTKDSQDESNRKRKIDDTADDGNKKKEEKLQKSRERAKRFREKKKNEDAARIIGGLTDADKEKREERLRYQREKSKRYREKKKNKLVALPMDSIASIYSARLKMKRERQKQNSKRYRDKMRALNLLTQNISNRQNVSCSTHSSQIAGPSNNDVPYASPVSNTSQIAGPSTSKVPYLPPFMHTSQIAGSSTRDMSYVTPLFDLGDFLK